jgi:U3 small nucleolar RNA-associated protein 13
LASGVVRFWDVQNAKELYVQENSLISKAAEEGGLSITQILFNKTTSAITVASVDHNIIIYDLNTFQHKKQVIF